MSSKVYFPSPSAASVEESESAFSAIVSSAVIRVPALLTLSSTFLAASLVSTCFNHAFPSFLKAHLAVSIMAEVCLISFGDLDIAVS